jgi:hypothetical protein
MNQAAIIQGKALPIKCLCESWQIIVTFENKGQYFVVFYNNDSVMNFILATHKKISHDK